MRQKVVVIGAGGHARSVIDIILQNGQYEVAGCVDDPQKYGGILKGIPGIPILGDDAILEKVYASGIRHAFVALGDNALRKRLFDQLAGIGFTLITVVSGFAHISPFAHIGKGTCVMAGAVVNVNAVVGDNCIINTNCSVDHDCIIGNHCHIAPGVAMSGTVHVGELTQIGTGASVIDKIRIGAGSYVGAGAVVVDDIGDGVMAYGVPARKIREYKS